MWTRLSSRLDCERLRHLVGRSTCSCRSEVSIKGLYDISRGFSWWMWFIEEYTPAWSQRLLVFIESCSRGPLIECRLSLPLSRFVHLFITLIHKHLPDALITVFTQLELFIKKTLALSQEGILVDRFQAEGLLEQAWDHSWSLPLSAMLRSIVLCWYYVSVDIFEEHLLSLWVCWQEEQPCWVLLEEFVDSNDLISVDAPTLRLSCISRIFWKDDKFLSAEWALL